MLWCYWFISIFCWWCRRALKLYWKFASRWSLSSREIVYSSISNLDCTWFLVYSSELSLMMTKRIFSIIWMLFELNQFLITWMNDRIKSTCKSFSKFCFSFICMLFTCCLMYHTFLRFFFVLYFHDFHDYMIHMIFDFLVCVSQFLDFVFALIFSFNRFDRSWDLLAFFREFWFWIYVRFVERNKYFNDCLYCFYQFFYLTINFVCLIVEFFVCW